MAIIKDLVKRSDVAWTGPMIFCRCQGWWTAPPAIYLTEGGPSGILICTSDLNAGRVFTCGNTADDCKKCQDYMKPETVT